jgi:hypothetical protein
MGDAVLQLKTDNSLLKALEKASSAKPDADELMEQRVSFIFGSLKTESNITHAQIKQVLVEQEGHTDHT